MGPCDASRKGAKLGPARRRGRRGCRAAALKLNQSRWGPGPGPHTLQADSGRAEMLEQEGVNMH